MEIVVQNVDYQFLHFGIDNYVTLGECDKGTHHRSCSDELQ